MHVRPRLCSCIFFFCVLLKLCWNSWRLKVLHGNSQIFFSSSGATTELNYTIFSPLFTASFYNTVLASWRQMMVCWTFPFPGDGEQWDIFALCDITNCMFSTHFLKSWNYQWGGTFLIPKTGQRYVTGLNWIDLNFSQCGTFNGKNQSL